MSFLNTKKTTTSPAPDHLNWMGGASYDLSDPLARLRMAASSCFFGEPMYYHRDKKDTRTTLITPAYRNSRLSETNINYLRSTLDARDPQEWRSLTPAALMEKAIDEALDHDPEETLKIAAILRNEDMIRTTPQVILVRAAHHKAVRGTGLVRRYAKQIIRRTDEPAVGLAYHYYRFKDQAIPNSLKKSWRDHLSKAPEYAVAKYRMESRIVKTVDVCNIVHPKSEAIHKLMNGELKTTGSTWEAIISEKGSTLETWAEAVPHMGHMALLRNLRNFAKVDLSPDVYLPRFVAGAAKGKQLPFRYYSAYRALGTSGNPRVLDGIEECLVQSLDNLPTFPGRVMSLCDNSGSATGSMTSAMGTMTMASIANLTGVLTGMNSTEGHLGIFGDRLDTFPIRRKSSVFDQLQKADRAGQGIGGGTENGIWLFWDKAIKQKEHWDFVFVYSDMQAGHGGLYGTDASAYRDYVWPGNARCIDVAKLIQTYRNKVNRNVQVFLVQVAGYQGTILPEYYDKTYILGGWGPGLLSFAARMAGIQKPQPQVSQSPQVPQK